MIIVCHRSKPSFSIIKCHMLIHFDFFPEASCRHCFCNPSAFWFGVVCSRCHSIGALTSANLCFSLHSFCRKRHHQEYILQSHGCLWSLGCVKVKPWWVKNGKLEFFIWGRVLCCSCKNGSLQEEQSFFFFLFVYLVWFFLWGVTYKFGALPEMREWTKMTSVFAIPFPCSVDSCFLL